MIGTRVLLIILGLAVGSFLNVVISRLATSESVVWGRSRCPHCSHPLGLTDVIPIVSYIFLAGRCRYCAKHIPFRYPVIEIGTALLFGLAAWRFSEPFDVLFWLFFVASFVVIGSFDIAKKEIPGAIVWPLAVGVLWYVLFPPVISVVNTGKFGHLYSLFADEIITGIITGGFILFIVLVTKEQAMGMGDVPIAALQGLLLGYPRGLYALLLSFILGALVAIALLLSKRAGLKSAVPFAPFLIAGLLGVLFFV